MTQGLSEGFQRALPEAFRDAMPVALRQALPNPEPEPEPEPENNNLCPIKAEKKSAKAYPAEFERLWVAYHPQRRSAGSKQATFRLCQSHVRKGAPWETLIVAAQQYSAACEQAGVEPAYVQLPETFYGDARGKWREAADPGFVGRFVAAHECRGRQASQPINDLACWTKIDGQIVKVDKGHYQDPHDGRWIPLPPGTQVFKKTGEPHEP
jgi:hypothetical protein